ncbi:cytokine receptor-like [Drosophila bipectinata]|uniref:cytokine receptor-like n=1 Tax=Drosophila bipectinata TaxID=42026 RepID=UPI001C89382E|nr:cytokine receptor-like [Drosophila bipectinata]
MEDLPGRPPEVVPNGFSHDPNHNSLYVFWTHLDELEWNGPDFTYTVANGHGKKALRIGNTSAVFDDWDASVSTTVYIWSENSRGPSLNKSQIKVPILKNANQHKPENLYYRKENHILFWNPPNDKKNLDGYTVYWCSATTNILQICDESEAMQITSLDSSQLQFQFPKSMIFSNMAVAARYTDKIGGGMQWTGYKWTSNNYKASDPSGAGISYYIAPIGVSILIGLIIYLYRKYKKCSNIKVIVPEFLERHMIVNTPAPAVFPGNLSPEFVMDVSQLMPPKKAQIEQEYKDNAEPKNDAQNNFTATGSYSAIFKKPFENDPSIATGSYCMTHL